MRPIAIGLSILASSILIACNSGNSTPKPAEAPKVETAAPVTLADVIAHPRRAEQTARDQFRHPQGTLDFFEVGPGKTVAEIWPGWYTNILAPYLAQNDGKYVAVLFPEGISENLDKRVASYKETYGDTDVYGEIGYGAFMKDSGAILPPESVDTLLTFRNTHSWMRGGYADQAFKEFYAALKPGGILGVVLRGQC